MKIKILSLFLSLCALTLHVSALVINEVMSNPIGDDSGREWIEIYNDSAEPMDLSALTISVKGGVPLVVTPLSGGTTLSPFSYAIIGSVVSGATKFSLDYPEYTGPLFKSSMSLVNTGVTSLDIRLESNVAHTISSYTAAKESHTYSYIQGVYVTGIPTPGKENESATQSNNDASTTTPNHSQVTIAQASPPSADILIFLPKEKTIVAGALANFTVSAMTGAGKTVDNVMFNWAFGDGGQKTGSSTHYRYVYPGTYIAQVEGGNGLMLATGRMKVRVVAPDVIMTSIKSGKYGPYISLINPNAYELDISDWKFSIDGSLFSFPRNTILGIGETKFPGLSMGFASTTYSTSTLIKLLFPTMDELLRITQEVVTSQKTSFTLEVPEAVKEKQKTPSIKKSIKKPVQVITSITSSTPVSVVTKKVAEVRTSETKDTRIAAFIKSFFSK